jgi:hypothetical protein
MILSSSLEASRLATKSPGCEISEKYDSIKLEGVQLQDEHAPLEVWDLHHECCVNVKSKDDSRGGSSFTYVA